MKKTDLAYIAGIIDGEGSIIAQRSTSKKGQLKRYNIIVVVNMTDTSAIELIRALFGGRFYKYLPRRSERKAITRWQVSGQEAEVILRAIKPYLLVKRAKAEVALRLLNIHPRGKRYTPMERFLQEADARAIKELSK